MINTNIESFISEKHKQAIEYFVAHEKSLDKHLLEKAISLCDESIKEYEEKIEKTTQVSEKNILLYIIRFLEKAKTLGKVTLNLYELKEKYE